MVPYIQITAKEMQVSFRISRHQPTTVNVFSSLVVRLKQITTFNHASASVK